MASKVYFAGRVYTTPTTVTAVNDSAMRAAGVSVGNLPVLLGPSAGGQSKTLLRFGDPAQAIAVLKSGDLLDAVLAAFDPSQELGGPAVVAAMSVNPKTQSALSLLDSASAASVALTSVEYGLQANQIKVKVEAGTTKGKRVTVAKGSATYAGDNIGGTAVLSVTTNASSSIAISSQGVLTLTVGATPTTVDLNTYTTIQAVADRLSVVSGVSAVVIANGYADKASSYLDAIASVAAAANAAMALYADAQAVIDWASGPAEPLLTAARAAAGTWVKAPANLAYTFLSGATDTVAVNQDWTDALSELQKSDVQWVTPASGNSAIHAMVDAHCGFMSTVGRKERRAMCGTAAGTSDAAAITAAFNLNSDRTSLIHIGIYDYDLSGTLKLYPPYITAAKVTGMWSAVSPGTPLTNKLIKCQGLERELRNPTDTDPLIDGGVFCIEKTDAGYKVVRSISTWITNNNFNKVEQSCGWAVDYTNRNVRNALDEVRGKKVTPELLGRAKSIVEGVLKEMARPEPQGPGVIVGWRNIVVSADGDVIYEQHETNPAIGANFVLSTNYVVPFSGSTVGK